MHTLFFGCAFEGFERATCGAECDHQGQQSESCIENVMQLLQEQVLLEFAT